MAAKSRTARRLERQLLETSQNSRDDCFITNTVKCRPAANRTPAKAEIDTCVGNYLLEQIELVNPKLIMLLGAVAAKKLLGVENITEARGRVFDRGRHKCIVGYHPAAPPVYGKKDRTGLCSARAGIVEAIWGDVAVRGRAEVAM